MGHQDVVTVRAVSVLSFVDISTLSVIWIGHRSIDTKFTFFFQFCKCISNENSPLLNCKFVLASLAVKRQWSVKADFNTRNDLHTVLSLHFIVKYKPHDISVARSFFSFWGVCVEHGCTNSVPNTWEWGQMMTNCMAEVTTKKNGSYYF